MKRLIPLMLLILIFQELFSASIDISLISIDNNLFNSQEKLDSFFFKSSLTKSEEEYYSNIDIYLLTGGAGSLVWENFGHSAFVASFANGNSISFDYGMFSFSEGFYKNFALGRLYYSLVMGYAEYRVSSLISDDRDVEYLPLILDSTQKRNLLSFLEYNAREENSTYLYNYYYDNCATRLRDIYDKVQNGNFRKWAEEQNPKETFRDYTKRYLSRSSFIIDWGINFLLGPEVDKPITLWQAMFLPDILNESIARFQENESEIIYKSQTRSDTPNSYNFFLRSIILTLLISIPLICTKSRKRNIRRVGDVSIAIIYLVLAVLSSALLFLMTASIHDVTYFNENIIFINPLLFLLSVLHLTALGQKERRKWLKGLSVFFLILALTSLLAKIIFMEFAIQDNLEYYILALALYSIEVLPRRNQKP